MSIIYDALKKAQTELASQNPPPPKEEKTEPPAPPAVPLPAELPTIIKAEFRKSQGPGKPQPARLTISRDQWLLILTSAVCACLLGGMIYMLNWISVNGFTRHKRNTAIVINGVMLKKDKTVALINNEVYETGEMINGMKIVAITLDRIDFLYRGKTRSIKVHRKLNEPAP